MRLRRLHPVFIAALAACLALPACSTMGTINGGNEGDDDDDDDVADAGPQTAKPDARPGTPDARPGAPDADPDDPDADPDDPDASIPDPPDADIPDPDEPDAGPVGGLGPWTGHDNVPWSQHPPFGLAVNRVPQLVAFGFDDNGYSGRPGSGGTGGFSWALEMARTRHNPAGAGHAGSYDGTRINFTFYMTSVYIAVWGAESPVHNKQAWHTALTEGHEIGDHTQTHSHGAAFTTGQWADEIQLCIDWLVKPFLASEDMNTPDNSKGAGVPRDVIYGFRTPFLEYDDELFGVLLSKGFRMDVSVEEGYQEDINGRNMPWPFTLDHGSPGNEVLVDWHLDPPKEHMTNHPGLWELPPHPVIVPPDNKCAQYGLNYSLRDKMQALYSWWDKSSGKVTGLDYNLFVQFHLNKQEFLAVMKYTLDERLAGNRAPMMFGAHTDIYSSKYPSAPWTTAEERQQAVEEFIDYALSKPDVRVVSNKQILDWVRNPVPLH